MPLFTPFAGDPQVVDIAGLTPTDNGVIIGNGTNFVVESGATLKTSVGFASSGANTDITSLTGTITNDDAAAGKVGEFATAARASGSAVSLTTTTATDITSVSLTAGDWDVSGVVVYLNAGGSLATQYNTAINTTSATFPTVGVSTAYTIIAAAFPANTNQAMNTGTVRLSLSGTTTVYLIGLEVFTVGTATAYGTIRARRVR
jgi:hypothetical protein